MSENSAIEWTNHTFNPWWGCVKISPGCKFCYADRDSTRWGYDIFGVNKDRRFFGDGHWSKPLLWNRNAERAGRRALVFCASMADVFEDRADLDEHRDRLFRLIERTPNLIWLLLTKRPENMLRLVPHRWAEIWPENTCAMTSVENQAWAGARRLAFQAVPCALKGVSYEPALGLVDWTGWDFIDWLICGGESGNKARPMNPQWAQAAMDFAVTSGIAFHFKQWGAWLPIDPNHGGPGRWSREQDDGPHDGKPYHMFTCEWSGFESGPSVVRVGKKVAGRVLDGRTWDEHPFNLRLHESFNPTII